MALADQGSKESETTVKFGDVFPEVKPIQMATLQGNDAFFPAPRPGSERFCWSDEGIRRSRSLKDYVMCRVLSEEFDAAGSGILDTRGETLRRWSRVFLAASLLFLFVNPVFFYIPQVDDSDHVCMEEDRAVKAMLTVMRSWLDIIYYVQIFIWFRTAYISPGV